MPKILRRYTISGSGTAVYQMATTAAATISSTAVAINCPGIRLGEVVRVSPPAAGCGAGISIGEAYVTANDAVSVKFVNPTAGNVTPTAPTATDPYYVIVDG